ncbi:MAG: 16S rRNA (adenine(1518)-N(6)/adenine(1519)-N(6))-dimethyltransferase RsmA, partial [Kiritimatiellaeota bacterium]|nr:16S rRNA (adenine(1518)-N(6)/adenine(1519)-N(6))-dimethyltransferase RsmA [Kiritimatiellota bacterium]
MKLTKPSDVRALLAAMDFHPSRVLGQNFLIDANILNILLDAAELTKRDAVLEVGPGLGGLTEGLRARAGLVVAVDKDSRLFQWLENNFAGFPNLGIIHSDILDVDLAPLLEQGVNKCVANLPYAVGSRFLVDLLGAERAPERIVVTVQFEVAERFAAEPGTHDYGLVSVLAQLDYAVTIHKRISPTCFWPPPEVTSAILLLVRRANPLVPVRDRAALLQLLKFCFSKRRKQIGAILRGEYADTETALAALEIASTARPENLAPGDWARLSE